MRSTLVISRHNFLQSSFPVICIHRDNLLNVLKLSFGNDINHKLVYCLISVSKVFEGLSLLVDTHAHNLRSYHRYIGFFRASRCSKSYLFRNRTDLDAVDHLQSVLRRYAKILRTMYVSFLTWLDTLCCEFNVHIHRIHVQNLKHWVDVFGIWALCRV